MKINQAQQKIQRILRDNLYERKVLSRHWSVEFNRLAHWKTSRMLFSKKLWESWKHYNFTLLLDMSGSMHWRLAIDTIKACQNIIRLLKWIVNIKVSVFNNWHFDNIDQDELLSLKTDEEIKDYYESKYMGVYLYVKKDSDWMGHLTKEKQKWQEFITRCAWWNCETINIDYEYRKLMQQDWHPVLIVLQDWELAADERLYWYSLLWRYIKKWDDEVFAKRLYSKISKDIELLSIGIWTLTPEDFYENFAYAEHPEDVYKIIVKVFERLIS